ncbi:hypothetical protein P3T76_010055 [Phytophthora citrophthora]|uniref:Uncharacterized protein n=1 Tax=Phytophthora citrophthora TaxID=4793 RepID=A0AAD9LHI4_9STRA|nr:hypothetical protein P3T76_010055 [Phytophthora citrophthora]
MRSSRDRSNSHGRRSVDPPPRKPPISSVDTLPKSKIDDNQEVKEAALEGRNLEERHTPATGNNHWGSSAHGNSYGYNHQHFHSRRPLQHDARALSSSPAPQGSSTPAKSVVASDHVTISSPRGGISSTSTPPKSSSNGNHHTSPVVNPVLEKKREAQRESHRAYLKSKSDYNCAEQKYISIEAELRLAEFWLDVMTKNLEDVGKRIEVHDWNFQKIVNEEESDDA